MSAEAMMVEVTLILKAKFPNLTTDETVKLAAKIVAAVKEEARREAER